MSNSICSKCNGTGVVLRKEHIPASGKPGESSWIKNHQETCLNCGGSGSINSTSNTGCIIFIPLIISASGLLSFGLVMCMT